MATATQEVYEDFKALIEYDGGQNEIECGNYLHHAIAYLLPMTVIESNFDREDRNFFGNTDFVISAKLIDDASTEAMCAFIWELKAPQCYLLEKDDNRNRFRPTMDLVKAENQLLHYYQEAIDNDGFRQRFGVMDRQNIRLGGIIIGRSDRLARSYEERDKPSMDTALKVRKEYFYSSRGIRLFNWDRLLTFIRPPKAVS
jgi:hypothetical protein